MASDHNSPEFSSFESVPDAVIVVDRDRSIVHVNVHAKKLFGYERDQLIGRKIETLIPEKLRSRHTRLAGQFFKDPVVRPMGSGRELHALRRDGQEFPVEIAIGSLQGGKFSVAVIRDITSLMKVRTDLGKKESEAHNLDQSFRNTPIGLCYLDKELRYVRVNSWLAKINGLAVKEHIGRKIVDVLPDVAAGVESQLRQVLQTGEPVLNGLVDATTPTHPTTPRTFMHNYFPDKSANGVVVGITCVVQDITNAKKELEGALAEIKRLKNQLQAENIYFQEEIKSSHDFDEIIGNSSAMIATIHKVELVAETDATVLLLGETGTGKELLARAIHSRSKRKARPLIKVDCTTLPSGLIETELFGHEKGAYTGAHEQQTGRFELADKGTLFLDEIGELPIELQGKLLRVIQDGEFERLGGRTRQVDVRVIAATNRNLHMEMQAGRFRSDLYYRLSIFPIEAPPLRDRREDIPLLTSFFVSHRSRALGKNIASIPRTTMDALMAYDWPGNIRELQNVCERAIILSPGRELVLPEELAHSEARWRDAQGSSIKEIKGIKDIERNHIREVLEESSWKIKGEGNAASRLGLKPSTLRSRMKRLGIERPI